MIYDPSGTALRELSEQIQIYLLMQVEERRVQLKHVEFVTEGGAKSTKRLVNTHYLGVVHPILSYINKVKVQRTLFTSPVTLSTDDLLRRFRDDARKNYDLFDSIRFN